MDIILAFHIIFVLILSSLNLKDWDVGNRYGKFIIKLKTTKIYTTVFLISLLVLLGVLALGIQNYINEVYSWDITKFLDITTWILMCLLYIAKSIKYTQIRENGIYLNSGFFKWEKLLSYKWISPDEIVFEFKKKTFFTDSIDERIKVSYENKKELDDILQKYIDRTFYNQAQNE